MLLVFNTPCSYCSLVHTRVLSLSWIHEFTHSALVYHGKLYVDQIDAAGVCDTARICLITTNTVPITRNQVWYLRGIFLRGHPYTQNAQTLSRSNTLIRSSSPCTASGTVVVVVNVMVLSRVTVYNLIQYAPGETYWVSTHPPTCL